MFPAFNTLEFDSPTLGSICRQVRENAWVFCVPTLFALNSGVAPCAVLPSGSFAAKVAFWIWTCSYAFSFFSKQQRVINSKQSHGRRLSTPPFMEPTPIDSHSIVYLKTKLLNVVGCEVHSLAARSCHRFLWEQLKCSEAQFMILQAVAGASRRLLLADTQIKRFWTINYNKSSFHTILLVEVE